MKGQWFTIFYSLAAISAVFSLLALICWSTGRRALARSPIGAPLGTRHSKRAEALMVLLVGGTVLAIAVHGTWSVEHTRLVWSMAKPYWIAFTVFAGAVCVVGVVVSAMGRSTTGPLIVAITIAVYTVWMNDGILELVGKDEWFKPDIVYSFDVSQQQYRGAECWVNGVKLGKVPFEIGMDEFFAEVPVAWKPPAGKKREHGYHKIMFRDMRPFTLSRRGRRSGVDGTTSGKMTDLYVRLVHNGRYSVSMAGVTGMNRVGSGYDCPTDLNALFDPTPEERARSKSRGAAQSNAVRQLVNHARLNGFNVSDGWTDLVSRINPRLLSTMLDIEPKLRPIIRSAVAQGTGFVGLNWKDSLHRAVHEKEALSSLRLRLVCEWLGEQFGKELDDAACVQMLQMLYTDFSPLPKTPIISQLVESRRMRNGFPEFQNKLAIPLIRRRDYDTAAIVGGPAYETYVIRKYRRDPRPTSPRSGRGYRYHWGTFVNPWLERAAVLTSDRGREFRQRHQGDFLALAVALLKPASQSAAPPEFLFMDHEPGRETLALAFWPEYSNLVTSSFPPWPHDHLKKRWSYLNRLGNAATYQMYYPALNEYMNSNDAAAGVGMDSLRQLVALIPVKFRSRLLKELARKLAATPKKDHQNLKLFIPIWFQVYDPRVEPPEWYRDRSVWYQGLVGPRVADLPTWEIIAKHPDPMIRVVLLKGIEDYPTPERVAFLKGLESDRDPTIREKAEKLRTKLNLIKMTLPKKEDLER